MYELRFHPEFFDDVKKLDHLEKERLVKNYAKIKDNPERSKHLAGGENCYTVRIGSLRVVYYVEGEIIWFLIVERRDSVYEAYFKRLHSLRTRFLDQG